MPLGTHRILGLTFLTVIFKLGTFNAYHEIFNEFISCHMIQVQFLLFIVMFKRKSSPSESKKTVKRGPLSH